MFDWVLKIPLKMLCLSLSISMIIVSSIPSADEFVDDGWPSLCLKSAVNVSKFSKREASRSFTHNTFEIQIIKCNFLTCL